MKITYDKAAQKPVEKRGGSAAADCRGDFVHQKTVLPEMAIGRGLIGGKDGVAPRTPPTAEIMAALMKEAIRFYNNGERYGFEDSGRSPEGSAVLFNRSCYIELSFTPAQLCASSPPVGSSS